MSDESAKSFESFYTLHDDFEPEATGGIRWLVNPSLVRSIECWCQHIYDLEPLDKKLIIDRTHVRQHFDRWCVEVDRVHQLDRETLIESLCQHLFDRLRLYPQDLTIRWHWIAFFMHRCLVVGWKVWRLIPPQIRSIQLFQEIILASYAQTANFDRVNLLSDFNPGKSQLVSGFRHISVYVDRQIKYSI